MKRTFTMLALLGATLAGLAQETAVITSLEPKDAPKEAPKAAKDAEPTLSELLERGMKRNPDIMVAEAKTRLAEAEMLKSRSEVVAAITATHAELATNRVEVQGFKGLADQIEKAYRVKAVSEAEKSMADTNLLRAEQKLTATKLKLASLTGGEKPAPATTSAATPVLRNPLTATEGTTAATAWLGLLNQRATDSAYQDVIVREYLRHASQTAPDSYTSTPAALRKSLSVGLKKMIDIKIDPDADLSLKEVMRLINQGVAEDLAILCPTEITYAISLPSGRRSLANWLMMIQDNVPLQFVVREYGLVLTTPKDGNTSVTLRTFLKDMEKNEVNAVPQPTLAQPTQATPVPPMKK